MNPLYIVIAVIVLLVLYRKLSSRGFNNISTQELKSLMKDKSKQRVYIDVRTPAEFKNKKIKGFRNMPLGGLSSSMNQLPKDKQIVIICQSGSRSSSAYKQLAAAGFTDLVNVQGGMNQWRG